MSRQAKELLKQIETIVKQASSEKELQKLSSQLDNLQSCILQPKLWEFEVARRKQEEEEDRREAERLTRIEWKRKRSHWDEVLDEIKADGVSIQRESFGDIPGTVSVTSEVYVFAEKMHSGGRVVGMANVYRSQPAWVTTLGYEYPRIEDSTMWTPRPPAGKTTSITSVKVFLYFFDHADQPPPPEGCTLTVLHHDTVKEWKVANANVVDANGTVVSKFKGWDDDVNWYVLRVTPRPQKQRKKAI
jgi:hypothetical protein